MDTEGGLLRGTLDVLILKAVTWGPRHGYAIAEWIKAVTDSDLLVEEGPCTASRRRVGSRVSGDIPTTTGGPSTTS